MGDAGKPPLRAWLYHQGECDGAEMQNAGVAPETARALYASALMELADAVLADYGAPMIVARIVETRPGFVPINEAIADVAAAHPNVWLGPWTDDLELKPDRVHVQDVETLAVRWANSVLALLQ